MQQLSTGGAGRAILYLAKYSGRLDSFEHSVLSLLPPTDKALELAREIGVAVHSNLSDAQRADLIAKADIVQLSWWNNPEMFHFLKSELPPLRSICWYHVGGQSAPHVITEKLLSYFDLNMGCSPFTYKCNAFERFKQKFPHRVAMVYGATDFARLADFAPRSHSGFNVGYLGTMDFLKMHPEFVEMSLSVEVPGVKFLLGGAGSAVDQILAKARAAGREESFEYRGYVDDVREILSELDVYGYPLCRDTYAASEMNLQEVMFAGIPAVVFPHGGITELVQHEQTGLVVHSATEYKQAIERLYQDPALRQSLGANAKRYAETTFGAEVAGRAVNHHYHALLKGEKRKHHWTNVSQPGDPALVNVVDLFHNEKLSIGVAEFMEFLGDNGATFMSSMLHSSARLGIEADMVIMKISANMHQTGLEVYRQAYPQDAFLNYWSALVDMQQGRLAEALLKLIEAANKNFPDWRVWWFLTQLATRIGQQEILNQTQPRLIETLTALGTSEAQLAARLLQEAGWGLEINFH